MPGDDTLLEMRAVDKSYRSGEGAAELAILRGVDLRVRRGEAFAIVGPSGSGKTTVLNLLGTLDRPDAGQVLLEGRDLAVLDEREVARVRNRFLGFVFQFHHLLPHLTVLENVLIPTLACDDAALNDGATDRALRLLRRVGLDGRLDHRPGQLSGGERQRVAVVRALINEPKVLLADEPTGALDHRSAKELGRLLLDLNREEGVTLILVTHSLELAREVGRAREIRDASLVDVAAA